MINSIGHYYTKGRFAFLKVGLDFGRYFRKLFDLERYGVQSLQPPSNGYHITIASPYDDHKDTTSIVYRLPESLKVKGYFDFSIIMEPYTNGNAFWYPVVSKDIELFRSYNKIKVLPDVALHYCVGYLEQGKCEQSKYVVEKI